MKLSKNLNDYGSQDLSVIDKNILKNFLTQKYITNDKNCAKFEEKLAKFVGSKYAVSCNNGTAAIMMSVLAARDKNIVAIIPNINFVAAFNVLKFLNAKIILSDVNPKNGMTDKNEFEKILKYCDKKKIVPNIFIFVHYAGFVYDIKEIAKICRKRKITLIEDGCHSFGGYLNGSNFLGSCKKSLMTTFSFHPVKNITTIEGGAVTTNDKKIYQKLKLLRSHNLKKNSRIPPYDLLSSSLNFRLGELNAMLGIEQLKKINDFKKKRFKLVTKYLKKFKKMKKFIKILNIENKFFFWHLLVIKVENKFIKKKNKLINFLRKNHIGCQVHYKPLSLHNYCKKNSILSISKNSKAFYDSQLTLPLHVKMKISDIDYIYKKINFFFHRNEVR